MALKQRIDSSIIFVVLILIILGGTALFIYLQVRSDAVSARVTNDEQFAVLFTVSGEDGSLLLTQTLMYEPSTARAAMFDIPANMGAILQRLGRTDRVAELFAQEGIHAYRDFISETLAIDIPFYIHLNAESASQLVDLVAGVELLVMEHTGGVDLEPDLASIALAESNETNGIDRPLPASRFLPSGHVRLEGPKAMLYLSNQFAGEENAGVVNRRQSFVESLLSRIADQHDLLSEGQGLDLLEDIVETNMDRRALRSLIGEIERLDTERIVRQQVTGSYRTVDVNGQSRNLLFPHFEGQWLRETVSQISDSLDAEDHLATAEDTIVIEVLNGTTTVGLARRTRDLYQSLGLFEVYDYDNADSHDYERTQVIDRRGDGRSAARVAEVIQTDNIINRPDNDPSNPVDVTLILGQDFDGRFVRQ